MTSPLWQALFMGPRATIETLSHLIDSEAISSFEVDAHNDVWRLQALYVDPPLKEHLETLIRDLGLERSTLSLSIEALPPCDWLAENRKSFPPLALGSFYIYGSHHEDMPLPQGKICLHIDAATAFGTGQHATTQGCLSLLEDLQNQAFDNGLDIGTGTGILAMAGARLLGIPFVAVDIDEDAVEMASENITKNKLNDWIDVGLSDGTSTPVVQNKAPYSLVCANILAEPLMCLAEEIVAITKPKGSIILSGLMHHQSDAVLEAYHKAGCTHLKTHRDGDWCSLLLQRL